jgi:flagellar protein FliO/FliZ
LIGMDATILLAAVLALADPGESNRPTRLLDSPTRTTSSTEPAETAPDVAEEEPAASETSAPEIASILALPEIDEEQPINRVTSPVSAGKPLRRIAAPGSQFSLWPGLLALAGVLALVALLTVLVRRFAPRVGHMSAGQIEVVGRSFLSAKQSVALVRVGDRIVVVGICPESISSLLVIDDPVEVGRLSLRTRGGQAAFERLVQAEAMTFADAARDDRSAARSTAPGAGRSGSGMGIQQLLARVKARVQQI